MQKRRELRRFFVYEIMYTVSDKDGNTTQQMRTITVIEVENDN